MTDNFLLIIVDHPRHGPVAISTSNRIDFMLHLPHPIDFFEPFGTQKIIKGKLFSKYHRVWQKKKIKPGQEVDIYNQNTGQSETYKVLFVATNPYISTSNTVATILKSYAADLAEASGFSSNLEYYGYTEAFRAFFKAVLKFGYSRDYRYVTEENFRACLNSSASDLMDLNEVTLIYIEGGRVRLDEAAWYLMIYKLNYHHFMKPPFPFIF